MAWIKVDDQMVDHPKYDAVSSDAFKWAHRGLSYANRYLTNGVLPLFFTKNVPTTVMTELTTIAEGQKNPIWHAQDNGTVRIHDYRKYQPSKAAVERAQKLNKKRQKKWRDAHGVSEGKRNGVINGAPAQPSPAPIKRSPQPPAHAGGSRRRRTRPLTEAQQQRLDRQQAAIDEQLQDAQRKAGH